MTKHYNETTFKVDVTDTKSVYFYAYSTNTRCGFCHTVRGYNNGVTDTKVSYYNRTWERFNFETALIRAAEKIGKDVKDAINAGRIHTVYNGHLYNCL